MICIFANIFFFYFFTDPKWFTDLAYVFDIFDRLKGVMN